MSAVVYASVNTETKFTSVNIVVYSSIFYFKLIFLQVVAPINKLVESVPFDMLCYSLDWHPADHISFVENVGNRPLDPSSSVSLSNLLKNNRFFHKKQLHFFADYCCKSM